MTGSIAEYCLYKGAVAEFNAPFWKSIPLVGAIEDNWLGADLTVTILDDEGRGECQFVIKDIDKGIRAKGRRSKYADGMMIALPICKLSERGGH